MPPGGYLICTFQLEDGAQSLLDVTSVCMMMKQVSDGV